MSSLDRNAKRREERNQLPPKEWKWNRQCKPEQRVIVPTIQSPRAAAPIVNMMATEFLPICDNLFNVISLAAYFCDCVFDIVLGYALLERGRINFFIAVVLIISGSLIVSQVRMISIWLKMSSINCLTIVILQLDSLHPLAVFFLNNQFFSL